MPTDLSETLLETAFNGRSDRDRAQTPAAVIRMGDDADFDPIAGHAVAIALGDHLALVNDAVADGAFQVVL